MARELPRPFKVHGFPISSAEIGSGRRRPRPILPHTKNRFHKAKFAPARRARYVISRIAPKHSDHTAKFARDLENTAPRGWGRCVRVAASSGDHLLSIFAAVEFHAVKGRGPKRRKQAGRPTPSEPPEKNPIHRKKMPEIPQKAADQPKNQIART